jgi:hypothetical protein
MYHELRGKVQQVNHESTHSALRSGHSGPNLRWFKR